MQSTPELHPPIVALAALAANIASNHPNQGLCQIDRLKGYGVARAHIDTVIEIARHIRDEAASMLDQRLDAALASPKAPATLFAKITVVEPQTTCCTPTASGKSCC
jgi:hypothetical protein